jgi:hypothetical protein
LSLSVAPGGNADSSAISNRDCFGSSDCVVVFVMNTIARLALGLALVSGVTSVACSAAPTSEGDTPSVSLDSAAGQDEGASYNGWSQYAFGNWDYHDYTFIVGSILGRDYGDATRGGGACFVRRKPGTSCSSDSTCLTAAQAEYGGSAWGYCYSGTCYSRPGAQASNCALNPNRAPGIISASPSWSSAYNDGNDFVVGCMTKTGGPNTACGGVETSLYMRTMGDIYFDYNPN